MLIASVIFLATTTTLLAFSLHKADSNISQKMVHANKKIKRSATVTTVASSLFSSNGIGDINNDDDDDTKGSDIVQHGAALRQWKDHAMKLKPSEASARLHELTESMNERNGTPFTATEVDHVIHSLQNVIPTNRIDWDKLQSLLLDVAHLSHKNWTVTETNAAKIGTILLKNGIDDAARQMLSRILQEGNWDNAVKHSRSMNQNGTIRPWAVLVTGLK